jgi:predicted ATPase
LPGETYLAADDAVFLNELLQLPQPTSLRPLFDAMDNTTRNQGKRRTLIRLLERASAVRPRLLIVEDIHWADRLTLTYLAELTITVTQLPALLVMTSRIDGDPINPEWLTTRGDNQKRFYAHFTCPTCYGCACRPLRYRRRCSQWSDAP